MNNSLQLGQEKVEPMSGQLESDLSEAAIEKAKEYAKRADYEHPINRSPKGIAAGAIYLSSLLHAESVTQREIYECCGVCERVVSETWVEIAKHEGIKLEGSGSRNRDEQAGYFVAAEECFVNPGANGGEI